MTGTKKDNLELAQTQAKWFGRIREAHLSETAEDYVELIADLIDIQGEARVVDLAQRFGVSHATVNKAVARLNRDGYVTNKPYRSVFLTEKGRNLARSSKKRHDIVLSFLLALGISEDTAKADSEGIEHHVSLETLKAFKKFVSAKKKQKTLK